MSEEKEGIEIIEEVQKEEGVEKLDLSELGKEEVELINKHKLVDNENEDDDGVDDNQGDKDNEAKKVDNDNKEESVINDDKKPSFEEVEGDEKLIEKYNRNEKAFYWKWKTDKHKRQEAQKRLNELEEKYSNLEHNSVYQKKIDKIAKLLNENSENLTIEDLQSIINEKVETEKVIKDVSQEDKSNSVNTKLMFAEKIGMAKYDNFIDMANLANEMFKSNGTYNRILTDAINNDDIDENQLVETIVSISRLNPKYKDIGKTAQKENIEKANKVIENSKRKISSASVASSNNRRVVSYKDLTLQQLASLPMQKYNKVPKEVRDRLLRGAE